MDYKEENEQIDEGAKDFINMAFIAGLLAIPGMVEAKAIYDSIPNKPTKEQIEVGLKKASAPETTYGGYTALQLGNILTRTLYAEAKGESLEGKKMVATVLWNRAGGKLDRMADVCFARKQFSAWNDYGKKSPTTYEVKIPGSVGRNPISEKAWKECQDIVAEMMNGKFKPLGNWNSYLNPETASSSAVNGWGSTMANQKNVGNHRFGYLEGNDGFLAKGNTKASGTSTKYPETYKVKKTDRGVSYIAKDLISQGKTPIKDLKKLTSKIIALNNLGTKATIRPNDVLKLPVKESFEIV